jgi:hypothetical protein
VPKDRTLEDGENVEHAVCSETVEICLRLLETQHVGKLHKELSSVIYEIIRRRVADSGPGLAQIAVVSHIKRGPRMNKVRDQEISIQ